MDDEPKDGSPNDTDAGDRRPELEWLDATGLAHLEASRRIKAATFEVRPQPFSKGPD